MHTVGINRIIASAYYAKLNGEIERRWWTMSKFLNCNTNHMYDLPRLLAVFLFACNRVDNASTLYSPFYLMIGFTPNSETICKQFAPKSSRITY